MMDMYEELFWHLSNEVLDEFLLGEISHFTNEPLDYLDMARQIVADLLVKRSDNAVAVGRTLRELQLGLPE